MDGKNNKQTLDIIEFLEDDDEKIYELQKAVYPDHPVYSDREKSLKFWRWWFREPQWRKSRVFGVQGNDYIAGVRPLSFMPMMISGAEELCGVLNATVTHPDCRKRGIFSASLNHVLDIAQREEGMRFLISFPNELSFPLHLKSKRMAALCDLPLFIKVFRSGALFKGKLFLPDAVSKSILNMFQRTKTRVLPEGYIVEETEEFDNRFDRLWERAVNNHKIQVQRTAQYLRWRYGQSPLGPYTVLTAKKGASGELAGYVIAKMESRFGMKLGLIIDLLVLPEEMPAASAMVGTCLSLMKERGADAAGCLMLRQQPEINCLRDNGMWYLPQWVFRKKFHVTLAALSPDKTFNDFILDTNNWYLTWGDTDNV
jgi:hypothetical protein